MNKTTLSTANLQQVKAGVTLPKYTPSEHKSGIVHIGIGAFHKAHQAVFTDDVLNMHGGDWRITAVSLRRPDARNQLEKQDNLYTVVEKTDGKITPRVIGAVEKVLVCPENPQQVIDTLASASTKIVSLTITEKGYCQKNGALDTLNSDIVHDLANLQAPKSMPGLIVAACASRKAQNLAGFTVMSCDNLPHNGKITQAVVLAFAQQVSDELAKWIQTHVSFCSTMVDRIVPAMTDKGLNEVEALIGLKDDAAIICEPFRQWVIEDNFIAGRPKWEDAGALLVSNVTIYEDMKLRLLNGSHSTLAYIGFLCGYTFIHEAIANPALCSLVKTFMDNDVTPTLDIPQGFDIEAYKVIIRERFANSCVPYKTTQVASDGSQKLPQRILAVAQNTLENGKQPQTLALIIAAWFQFLEAKDINGNSYTVNDPMADALVAAAQAATSEKQQVEALISASDIFPESVKNNTDFITRITTFLQNLHSQGALKVVEGFNH